jgi:endoribonuclease Dicer
LKAGEIPAVDEGPTIVLAAVLVHDTILAKETASSGRYAKIKASQVGLRKLKELDITQFREAYQCDCLKGDGEAAPVEDVMGSAV